MRNHRTDIADLAHHLKQEKLFIESEKQHIKNLNEKVLKIIEKVYHASFVRGEQRRNYHELVLRPHSSPPSCCQRSNLLSQLQFIDGYQILGHNESLFGEMLLCLRENPRLCAQCLVYGESFNQEAMQFAASVIFSSIYANCILPEDEQNVLSLVKNLTELQLASSENPRRLLHHGSCAFSQVYRTYVDTLPQAKVFLTAALHQPIMQLLKEDELFLDIDPSKAAVRFPPEERQKRFGEEGTKEYEEALTKYRSWTISKLVKITSRFIENIKEAMHCFPATLSWLVRTLYEVLMQSKKTEIREINAICIDLVFTFFICSAIVTPEPHGIVDAAISHISRFNLIQVAQILQVLAMNRWEVPDARHKDLYSHFDKEVMSGLIDIIIEQRGGSESPPVSAAGNCPLLGLTRSSCIIPESHLYSFINFLVKSLENMPEESESMKELESYLNRLKPQIHTLQNSCYGTSSTVVANNASKNNSGSGHQTGSPSSGSPKKNLLNRVKSSRKSSKAASTTQEHQLSDGCEDRSVSPSSHQLSTPHSNGHSGLLPQHSLSSEERDDDNQCSPLVSEYENVLVIGFPNSSSRAECPGMMPEDQVLSSLQTSKPSATRVRMNLGDDDVGTSSGGDGTVEKRTRFSLSHDDGSIGNTSDNLEAISEAASNHSVASSMDDVEQVDQPDNLSDMVSANVSGRGTPNVSGRDTPSSQVTEGDEGVRGGGETSNRVSNISVSVPKEASADIEEKFGRFEIKPILGGDETVSLVSDTWSTDVLASDSETIDAADREQRGSELHRQRFDQHLKELDRMHGAGPAEFLRGESAGETFETTSEAWSTDVLASDSERLTEFDTDDAQSVARSDDAGRSEVEVDMSGGDCSLLRPEDASMPEENVTPRANASPSEDLTGEKFGVEENRRRALIDETGICVSQTLLHSVSEQSDSRRVKYIPVMRVSEDGQPRDSSIGFKPICDIDEEQNFMSNNTNEESADGSTQPEASATQSLGRLSLTLSDFPNNGIIPGDQPLLLNTFMRNESSLCSEERGDAENFEHISGSGIGAEDSKRLCSASLNERSQRKVLSGGGSAEDNSIHLSTASLASSSSSSSDVSKELHQSSGALTGADSNNSIGNESMSQLPTAPATSTPLSSMASTGAIPKSISFDKTAERGDKDSFEGDSKHKRGFFKGFKLPAFKGRRKMVVSLSSRADDFSVGRSSLGQTDVGIRRSLSEDSRRPILEESTDDILAKYRKKPETSEVDGNQVSSLENPCSIPEPQKVEDERLFIDVTNVESSYAFKDAKRKLRMVLSSADFCMSSNFLDFPTSSSSMSRENDVLIWLKTQLAEAQSLHDRSLVAQLHEALRCIQLFDHHGRKSLVHSLSEDYQSRSPYIAYLVRSRQGLLNTIAHLEKLLSRLDTDTDVIMTAMVSVCVRMFLEKKDGILSNFTKKFTQLTVPDEKVELVESFLSNLNLEMERDPMWISSTSEQLNLAQVSLERAVMSHIYIHALYPNGDGDVSRDQVLYEHMKKLSVIITPNHKDLRISKYYQYECPWPSAQAELACLGAHKTSADKVRCVVRASQTIMNLLSMAHDTSVPAADDFIPVLVYVLIKANPPGLLSTVQYVNLFYEQRLQGEDQYWWTQFCSTIEFIKTMDYTP